MKRIMAIRTEDREYAEELAKNLNKSDEVIFQILIFTEKNAYEDYIKENRIDVLLCDEAILPECMKDSSATVICGLSEASTARDVAEQSNIIFKYQSSDDIMKEIMKRFNAALKTDIKTGDTGVKPKNIFCVCSPVGGSYSSTFALALAAYLAEREHTLFISFDPFFTLPGEEKNPAGKDLTDVIFYLNGMQPHLMEFLKKFTIKKGNLECINGVSHWFDLYDMSPENMHDLVENVCGDGTFNSVVFDVGIIGAASMEVLLAAGRIFTPYKEEAGSRKKLKEWKRQLIYCGKGDLLDKTAEICIPDDECLKGDYGFEALLSGRLGKYIKERGNKIY
ncbi:MAG: hypothetical protein IJL55_02340 [Lachnospiraceae bacterium]|nr:hypothetical protein [Lachnospiraceae bacterium]